MAQEVERKFLTTNYHLAVVRGDEIHPDYSQRRWLRCFGASTISIAHLAQYYLDLRLERDRVVEEDRVRRKVSLSEEGQPTQIKFTRTTKKGFGLSREEIEEEIDQPEFEHLIQSTKFLAFRTGKPPQIHKIRTTAEIGSLTLEIDRYLGPELGGLCVTEIEFPDRNKALSFNTKEDIPSGILSQELDPVIFGNAQLALSGKIPEGIILPGYLRSA